MGDGDGRGLFETMAAPEYGAEGRREREVRLHLPEEERVRLGYQRCGCERHRPHVADCPVGIEIDVLLDMSDRGLITWQELGDRMEALQAGG